MDNIKMDLLEIELKVVDWERRGTCISYWYESQRERDH
jgi:hypothetical protein